MWNIPKQLLLTFLLEIVFSVITAWLFFDFSIFSLGLLFFLPIALHKRYKESIRQKKWELNLAFKDAITCFSNHLAVGYSPESSLKGVVKELEQLYGKEAEICFEFRQMIKQIELGSNIEQVFLEFGRRSEVEDIQQLAEIFSIVKRTGGNLGQVLKKTEGILQDKIELKRELTIAIASKKLEFQVMCFVPYGILFYLKLYVPTMSNILYDTTLGTMVMFVVWISYCVMKAIGDWMIQGELHNVV